MCIDKCCRNHSEDGGNLSSKCIKEQDENISNIEEDNVEKSNEEGIDMATISFEREMVLNDTSAEALIRKIEFDNKNMAVIKDINIEKKLEEGKKLLKQLFSH